MTISNLPSFSAPYTFQCQPKSETVVCSRGHGTEYYLIRLDQRQGPSKPALQSLIHANCTQVPHPVSNSACQAFAGRSRAGPPVIIRVAVNYKAICVLGSSLAISDRSLEGWPSPGKCQLRDIGIALPAW